MASNINPTLAPTKSLDNFRFWCQKVLPLVYDDSLSYYEVLGKMVVQLNDVIDNINADTENVLTLKDAFDELQEYVDNFFDDVEHLADYAERAEAAQTAANSSAINAASSAVNASISSQAAMDARAAAQTAAQDATASKNDAITAATTATTKAGEAAQSAINAQTAQASASQNATLADAARTAAQGFANDAAQDASDASDSADAAATSEQNVENLVENLPSDFTELNNSVNALIDSVSNVDVIKFDSPSLFSTGIFNTNGGYASTTSTTRIRNTQILAIPQCSKFKLEAAEGFQVSVRIFKQPITAANFGLIYSSSDWANSFEYKYELKDILYLGFNYRKSDDGTLSVDDINETNAPTLTIYGKDAPATKTNHTKILLIGNSKSQNSADFLNKILSITNHYDSEVILPFKGGVSLQDHYDNKDNSSFYESVRSYYKYQNGFKELGNKSLTQLIAENTDITHVIFQQTTESAAISTSYDIIDSLLPLFYSCQPNPRFYIMATWANDESAFTTEDILTAVKTYAEKTFRISGIIPTGSVIEKAKTNSFFHSKYPNILMDGVHLTSGMPRLLASLAIIEAIYGVDTQYIPTSYSDDNPASLLNLCYQIVKATKPYTV